MTISKSEIRAVFCQKRMIDIDAKNKQINLKK